jgi:3-oxoacyl-[acyl-carrier protein] reductase
VTAVRSDAPVAFVTGSRKGIGAHLVRHLLEKGYRVAGCSRGALDSAIEGYTHFETDVTDERAVVKMFAEVRRTFGRLDVLVNNAGGAAMNHALLTPSTTVERLFHLNFGGTFVCAREGAKIMQARRFGRIVNFTTVAVPLHLQGEAVYASSKAAVEELTRILARELGPLGITVNAVGPTPIDTDLIKNVPEDKISALIARQAIARRGEMRDVTNVLDFFISPQSDFITGQVLYLGGV